MTLAAITLMITCVVWVLPAAGLLASWLDKHWLRARLSKVRWVLAAVLFACSGSIVAQIGQVLLGIACAVISIVRWHTGDADGAAAGP